MHLGGCLTSVRGQSITLTDVITNLHTMWAVAHVIQTWVVKKACV